MYNKNFFNEPTEKQKIGQVGEDYACEYLINKGYKVIERNYLKKWGEIDIVSKKNDKLYFIEVKSVTRESRNVTHVTPVVEQGLLKGDMLDGYRAEDNMHPWKLQRLSRIIQTYLLDKDVSDETNWQLDLITVVLDKDKRLIKIEVLEDIVI